MREIPPTKLSKALKVNALAGLDSMIWGPPGVGKSDIARQVADDLGAQFFEIRANLYDPVDVRGGLKVEKQDDGSYRTKYGVPEDYPDPDLLGPVCMFLDELPNAPKATMNAFLQLTLDKKLGTYICPKDTFIIAAGNRAIDRAAVHEMPTPLKGRFQHYTVEANLDDFCAWAYQNDIDPSITSFLRYRPKLLHDIDPSQYASPTPRTWAFLSQKLPFMNDMFYDTASCVGDGPAGEYLAYKAIYKDLPDINDIMTKPSSTQVPVDTAVLYAVCGLIASVVDQTNFKNAMKYISRLPSEYQVIAVRDVLAKDRTLTQEPSFTKWTEKNADVFL